MVDINSSLNLDSKHADSRFVYVEDFTSLAFFIYSLSLSLTIYGLVSSCPPQPNVVTTSGRQTIAHLGSEGTELLRLREIHSQDTVRPKQPKRDACSDPNHH